MESHFYTPEQHKMNCGKLVVSTLQSIGGRATADELLDELSNRIGESEAFIEPAIKKILRQAIRDGFLVKMGRAYLFPGYEVDARRVRSTAMTRKDRVAIASKAQNKRRRRLQLQDQAMTRYTTRQATTKSRSRIGTR